MLQLDISLCDKNLYSKKTSCNFPFFLKLNKYKYLFFLFNYVAFGGSGEPPNIDQADQSLLDTATASFVSLKKLQRA